MNDRKARGAAEEEDAPVLRPTEARQGTKGHNVRYVLSLGAVAALAVAYFAFFAS
jgi:hypothetical protein